ncbi:hypothetical protein VNO80_05617 [Phaseolus coccineus]|uniref:Protein kinase domain-containing protein n=1 Tax=Phaseolus coccineus TaxID=3886 RepID=A0AAN9RN60_PHACN
MPFEEMVRKVCEEIHVSTIDLPLFSHRKKLMSVPNNSIGGTVPSTIWQNRTLNATEELILLEGNPVCSNNNSLVQYCGRESDNDKDGGFTVACPSQGCPPSYEYTVECICAAPLIVHYRLKSPGFSDFRAYVKEFENFLTDGLSVHTNQLFIERFAWEEGRLRMNLKLFPEYIDNTSSREFSTSEVIWIRDMFREWDIHDTITPSSSSGISKGALAGIILGAIACAVTLSAIVSILILRIRLRDYRALSKRRNASRISLKVEGVRSFDYKEMALATNNFSESAQIGEGGYGKVYKGRFSDGTVVAIKRAQEGSLQGEREFLTEIELLSRLHHRNLVSLIGYCDEEGEQMLVYEYMPNGTLRDHLSAYSKDVLSFSLRLKIALGSEKGLLYLHTKANPPIFHRDVKASNISAKVSDFGLSRLAPVPDIEGNVPAHVSTVVKGTSVNMAYQFGAISLVVDKRIESYPFEYAVRFLTSALKCSKDLPDERPKMAEVARELEYICSMLLEPDSKGVEYVTSDSSGTILSSQPSSSTIKTPFISGDVSGSDLVSGSVPTIKPR